MYILNYKYIYICIIRNVNKLWNDKINDISYQFKFHLT